MEKKWKIENELNRYYIKIRSRLQIKPVTIDQELELVLGDDALHYITVTRLVNEFNEGRETTKDWERIGRPVTKFFTVYIVFINFFWTSSYLKVGAVSRGKTVDNNYYKQNGLALILKAIERIKSSTVPKKSCIFYQIFVPFKFKGSELFRAKWDKIDQPFTLLALSSTLRFLAVRLR